MDWYFWARNDRHINNFFYTLVGPVIDTPLESILGTDIDSGILLVLWFSCTLILPFLLFALVTSNLLKL